MGYVVAELAALRNGIDLAPLIGIPIALSAVGRPPLLGAGVGLLIGSLQQILHALTNVPAVLGLLVIGSFVGALVGSFVSIAYVIISRLAEQADGAIQARQRGDEIQAVYRTLYDGLPVGLYRSLPDGTFIDANPAFAEMFGYNGAEVLALNAIELYAEPDERAGRMESLFEAGVQRNVPIHMRDGSGRDVFIQTSSQAVRAESGEVSHIDGVAVNVTGEIVSEQRRLYSDELFRRAFEESPIGMVLADQSLTILGVNRAFEQFLGYESGELDGRTVGSISVPEDMVDNLRARDESTRMGAASYELQKRYFTKSGGQVIGMLTAIRLTDMPGSDDLYVGFFRDLREEIKGQLAVRELVRSKDEFLATIAHELRTPLTVVHGLAHELRDSWKEFSSLERRELAGIVADQSSELTYLVEDLLVAARADAGTLVVKDERVELLTEVRAAVESVRAGTQLVELRGESIDALADRLRVRQILRNLLTMQVGTAARTLRSRSSTEIESSSRSATTAAVSLKI